ncbi:hypothetical protein HAX54_035129 [Datura stramonium]|uniref:Uncharacterized protein n=1 Tax=Datura stramonium TaxID=4076 RepID=A0ABS8VI73_DATST|nr:hypothetical protein [Datura stramonium]
MSWPSLGNRYWSVGTCVPSNIQDTSGDKTGKCTLLRYKMAGNCYQGHIEIVELDGSSSNSMWMMLYEWDLGGERFTPKPTILVKLSYLVLLCPQAYDENTVISVDF